MIPNGIAADPGATRGFLSER